MTTMSDPLAQMKRRLSREYLGKAGIHGFGISRARGAIQVYVTPGHEKEQKVVLDALKQTASPIDVVVVTEDRPYLS
jgi:hypothetical protein